MGGVRLCCKENHRQTSKDPKIMVLVRRLVVSCMKCNLLIRAVHVPGKQNILPDLLSRFQIDQFRRQAPHMESKPTEVPDALLSLH